MKNRIIKWLGGYTSEEKVNKGHESRMDSLKYIYNKADIPKNYDNEIDSLTYTEQRIINTINDLRLQYEIASSKLGLQQTKAGLAVDCRDREIFSLGDLIKELESYIKPEYYVLHLPENGVYVPVREFKGVKEYLAVIHTKRMRTEDFLPSTQHKTGAKAQKVLEQWIELEKVKGL